jgi:hypothetical protein
MRLLNRTQCRGARPTARSLKRMWVELVLLNSVCEVIYRGIVVQVAVHKCPEHSMARFT